MDDDDGGGEVKRMLALREEGKLLLRMRVIWRWYGIGCNGFDSWLLASLPEVSGISTISHASLGRNIIFDEEGRAGNGFVVIGGKTFFVSSLIPFAD